MTEEEEDDDDSLKPHLWPNHLPSSSSSSSFSLEGWKDCLDEWKDGWMDGEWLKLYFFTNNRQFFLEHAPL